MIQEETYAAFWQPWVNYRGRSLCNVPLFHIKDHPGDMLTYEEDEREPARLEP